MLERVSVFVGPSLECRVWFLKFHISQEVFHNFLIREDINLCPEILGPNDRRYEF